MDLHREVLDNLGVEFQRLDRRLFQLPDDTYLLFRTSKAHIEGGRFLYWFGFQRSRIDVAQPDRLFILFICGSDSQVIVIAASEMLEYLRGVPTASDDNWKVKIYQSGDDFTMVLSGHPAIPISNRLNDYSTLLADTTPTQSSDPGGPSIQSTIIDFWWVNHKQTYKQELGGGYIWSPKQNKNGARNRFYENLTIIKLDDIIFSYANGVIGSVGTVAAEHVSVDRPTEFGQAGQRWDKSGWLVRVDWTEIDQPVKPKDFIAEIADLLPAKYSPISLAGNGRQGCYLASISDRLGLFLLSTASEKNLQLDETLDEMQVRRIKQRKIPSTEKKRLINARIGQGEFRNRLSQIEDKCRLTNVRDLRFLIASHVKPWKHCNDIEKLDGNNGLFLSPHADKLFDRGWVSFSKAGVVLCANALARKIMIQWNLDPDARVGAFSDAQDEYLQFHRTMIFKGA